MTPQPPQPPQPDPPKLTDAERLEWMNKVLDDPARVNVMGAGELSELVRERAALVAKLKMGKP